MFTVEVIYALLKEQLVFRVNMSEACTIEEAIVQSKIVDKYPEIDLKTVKVGIFNQIKNMSDRVSDGDRIEIYRELIANPKEARKKRALKQREEGVLK